MERSDIVAQLRTELVEAQDTAQRLSAAIEALEGSPAPVTDSKPVERRTRAPRATNGATPTDAGVLDLIPAEGIKSSEIADKLRGVSKDAVLRTLKALEDDGIVRREGERRTTTWHLVA